MSREVGQQFEVIYLHVGPQFEVRSLQVGPQFEVISPGLPGRVVGHGQFELHITMILYLLFIPEYVTEPLHLTVL